MALPSWLLKVPNKEKTIMYRNNRYKWATIVKLQKRSLENSDFDGIWSVPSRYHFFFLSAISSIGAAHRRRSFLYGPFLVFHPKVTITNISYVNPLSPKSDQHLISPYNITPESHIKVMRIEEMVTKEGTFWLANKFSLSSALCSRTRERYCSSVVKPQRHTTKA